MLSTNPVQLSEPCQDIGIHRRCRGPADCQQRSDNHDSQDHERTPLQAAQQRCERGVGVRLQWDRSWTGRNPYRDFSYPNFLDIAASRDVFQDLAAFSMDFVGLVEGETKRRVSVLYVSWINLRIVEDDQEGHPPACRG